ncbi:MAG: DUF1565 domain-containing protein [Kiritimatiellae bacterium]|nr:DUF1565 domain-containing protein [Kiritimatiellia bacterium]
MNKKIQFTAIALLATTAIFAGENVKEKPLSLPEVNIPENPQLPPYVITEAGQKILLGHVKDQVKVTLHEGELVSKPANWWIVNYPTDQIIDGNDKELSKLFGEDVKTLKNWYIKTPGQSSAEPSFLRGPAPVGIFGSPTMTVNTGHIDANDSNHGTHSKPLKSITEAAKRAKPGDIIHVYPGIYREKNIKFANEGTKEHPIILEGIRDAKGNMPVISANIPFEKDAFEPVAGLSGVYRAKTFTGLMGVVTVDGGNLNEKSWPEQLNSGEYCFNRGSKDFLKPRTRNASPKEGEEENGLVWKKITADEDGKLVFNPENKQGIFYISSWLWLPQTKYDGKTKSQKTVWAEGAAPVPVTGDVYCKGKFRAFRQTGTKSQVNKYRVWVNGEPLPSSFEPDKPTPHRNYGTNDRWNGMKFKSGWNHILFKFDVAKKMQDNEFFTFSCPEGKYYICSAERPPKTSLEELKNSKQDKHISEALVLGPFLISEEGGGIYVKLQDGANPNKHVVDLPVGGHNLMSINKPYLKVRGFEFQGGALFQQRALVGMSGGGSLLEGCLFKMPEVRAVSIDLNGKNQTEDPVTVRDNWVYSPGGLGFGASGNTDELTAENQSTTAPGRGRLLAEFNYVENNNNKGYKRMWESGGMKFFRLTGAVIRYNTFYKGDGPGIWLDWEHYNNRLDGNIHLDGNVFSVGVEASPGPNLICNSLTIDLTGGDVWFRWAILSWSSDRTWVAYNTIDDEWNQGKAWKGLKGADGIFLIEGPNDRGTRWGSIPKTWEIANNLCFNMVSGIHAAHKANAEEKGNYINSPKTQNGYLVETAEPFNKKSAFDYTLKPDALEVMPAKKNDLDKYVKHDINGMIRFEDVPQPAGAFRADPVATNNFNNAKIEMEFLDGTIRRNY